MAHTDAWQTWAPTEQRSVGTDGRSLDVPRFSLAERERRWGKVRELMRRDGLEAIVAPANTGLWDQLQANVRYLTGIGGGGEPVAAVFPLNGEVTAIPGPMPFRDYWLAFQDWVTDIRPCFFDTIPFLIDRISELGLSAARIGLAGLEESGRHIDGLIPHRSYQRLVEAFPSAQFVNATFLMDEARYVKSDEELAMMQQAIGLAEGALRVMGEAARPGVDERQVYGRMLSYMVEHGSEAPTMFLWAAGTPHPAAISMLPTKRNLRDGDVIACEVEARVAGYIGQVTQTALIGRASSAYEEMFALQQEAVAACYERLRPGTPLGDFMTISEDIARGTPYQCRVIIHSRGLGDDSPIIVFGTKDERMLQWKVEEGATFIVKPQVRTKDGTNPVYWGDIVVATDDGARRLGTRSPELMQLR